MRVYCIKSLNAFSFGHHGCGILAFCRSIQALYPNLMSTEGVSPLLSSVNENYMVLIERKRKKVFDVEWRRFKCVSGASQTSATPTSLRWRVSYILNEIYQ